MRDRARNFDTEQTRHTQKESKYTSDKASPDEDPSVPLASANQLEQTTVFALNDNERGEENCGTEVLPVRQLDGRVMGVRQGDLDQDSVYGDEQGREHAIEDGQAAGGSAPLDIGESVGRDAQNKSKGNDTGGENHPARWKALCLNGGDGNSEGKD